MTVYVENVLFENIVIDGLILFLVSKTLKEKTNWWGVAFSSLFGAVFALFSVKIDVSNFLFFVIKLCVCFCMSYMLCFSFKKIFTKSFLLLGYTFVFGGMVYAAFSVFGMQITDNFLYASSVPVVGIVSLCFVMFLCLQYCIKRFFAKKKISAFLYEITLFINNKKAVLNGFLDTGNTLVGKDGKPVVMISEKLLKNFFNSDEMLSLVLKKYQKLKGINPQELCVLSVAGKTKVLSFDARCQINKKDIDICVCVYDDKMFCGKGFDAILSPKMLEGANV